MPHDRGVKHCRAAHCRRWSECCDVQERARPCQTHNSQKSRFLLIEMTVLSSKSAVCISVVLLLVPPLGLTAN